MSEITERVQELLQAFQVPARELRCGSGVWGVLKDQAELPPPDGASVYSILLGVPVHVDKAMPDGAWKLLHSGTLLAAGDLAPGLPHMIKVNGEWLAYAAIPEADQSS